MPKTVAERQADSRERKRKAGMKFFQAWVSSPVYKRLQAIAKLLPALTNEQFKRVMAFIKSLTK